MAVNGILVGVLVISALNLGIAGAIAVGVTDEIDLIEDERPIDESEGTGYVEGFGYVRFEGVDGEVTESGHEDWSDILSFSQPITRPGSAAGGTIRRGDVIMEDIVLTKELDKASPKLAESICSGSVFPEVEIHITTEVSDEGRATFLVYELTNVIVAGYQVNGSANSDFRPVETISINFEEINVTYTEIDHDGESKGNIEYSWKVEEGEI